MSGSSISTRTVSITMLTSHMDFPGKLVFLKPTKIGHNVIVYSAVYIHENFSTCTCLLYGWLTFPPSIDYIFERQVCFGVCFPCLTTFCKENGFACCGLWRVGVDFNKWENLIHWKIMFAPVTNIFNKYVCGKISTFFDEILLKFSGLNIQNWEAEC